MRFVMFYERFGKPMFDRVVGIVLALVTSPVLLALMAVSFIAFRSWPIQRIESVGRNNEHFMLYKLRTLDSDLAERGRRRRLGTLLREWSLDEFPQFWNVVFGSMSLVGPRPLSPEAAAELVEWQQQRHTVKPGVTGIWQVESRGDGRILEYNTHIDVQYLDQISFWGDLKILLSSVFAVMRYHEGDDRERELTHKTLRRMIPFDVIAWAAAIMFAVYARPTFVWPQISLIGAIATSIGAGLLHIGWSYFTGVYSGLHRPGSREDAGRLAFTSGATTATLLLLFTLFPLVRGIPRSALLAAGAYQLVAGYGIRFFTRADIDFQRGQTGSKRLLIFGANELSFETVRALRRGESNEWLPVAFLDEDEILHRQRRMGLPVVGGLAGLEAATRRYAAEALLISVPGLDSGTRSKVADAAQAIGLDVRILPDAAEMIDGVSPELRQISLSDFLARDEINLDLEAISGYITGKRVLVTGAGGSIGSVLCEVLAGFQPAELIKLDHDENALQALQLTLDGVGLLQDPSFVLGDIRDQSRIMQIFSESRPDVVFHTAAHKHVSFLEAYPDEGVQNNVYGTLNVLHAAAAVGVSQFVNVSTDKAADPVNVLGITKRIAERLTAHFAEREPGMFISVRFGNVLGSKGSVVPTFRRQIEAGGPVTVTDAEVMRYFMTIEESCQLVVQAGAIGGKGDVLVLDMGEPVKVVDLARRLWVQLRPGTEPQITYTGLRPGEKLTEVLSGPAEILKDKPHDLIDRFAVDSLDPENIEVAMTEYGLVDQA
ncbi:MAG: polysaccharide biosynthesis protein [Acidimicrobiia bacterium]|nr:polysaccharide biosynthesis protein [Acidimicrobiia bacterium]